MRFHGDLVLYCDAGFRELLFESNVFALGSNQQILAGKFCQGLLGTQTYIFVDVALNNR